MFNGGGPGGNGKYYQSLGKNICIKIEGKLKRKNFALLQYFFRDNYSK